MSDPKKPVTFAEQKEQTACDCESFAKLINEVAVKVREGNMQAFEEFFIVGGTEEGDAKLAQLHELLLLRYCYRKERLV